MRKGYCGLHGLSTKKSAMTKYVQARQHINFMSHLIQHKLWPIGHGTYTWLPILCGHVIKMLDLPCDIIQNIEHSYSPPPIVSTPQPVILPGSPGKGGSSVSAIRIVSIA